MSQQRRHAAVHPTADHPARQCPPVGALAYMAPGSTARQVRMRQLCKKRFERTAPDRGRSRSSVPRGLYHRTESAQHSTQHTATLHSIMHCGHFHRSCMAPLSIGSDPAWLGDDATHTDKTGPLARIGLSCSACSRRAGHASGAQHAESDYLQCCEVDSPLNANTLSNGAERTMENRNKRKRETNPAACCVHARTAERPSRKNTASR